MWPGPVRAWQRQSWSTQHTWSACEHLHPHWITVSCHGVEGPMTTGYYCAIFPFCGGGKKKDDKKTKAFYDWATTGIPVIIALSEHWAIFHLLELYSTNQIPFCQIRLRSISCHFPVNKLHLITYSYRIVQLTEKNQMELNATGSEFFTQFFHVLTFLRIKLAFIYFGLYSISC